MRLRSILPVLGSLLLLIEAGSQRPVSAEAVLSLNKTSYETFDCSVDFTQVIGMDGLTLQSVTAKNAMSGLDTTGLIVAASPAPAVISMTDQVGFRVKGGVTLQTYYISIKVRDSMNGAEWEGIATLTIGAQ